MRQREERGENVGTARMKAMVKKNTIILVKYDKLQQRKTNAMACQNTKMRKYGATATMK